MVYLLTLFIALQVGDTFTTLYGMRIGLREGNVIARYLIGVSKYLWVGLKTLCVMGVYVTFLEVRYYSLFWSLVVVGVIDLGYLYVVIKNIILIRRKCGKRCG